MEQIGEALGAAEGARAAAALLDAPQPAPACPPALARARLHAARQLVATKLFTSDDGKFQVCLNLSLLFIFMTNTNEISCHSEACNILLTTICRHVRTHLLKRDELEECAGLLGDAISSLYEYREENKSIAPAHLDVLCLGVFNALVDALLNLVGRTTQVLVLFHFL